jgi:hypothetical protein
MVMTYDTWKTTEPEEFYSGPSNDRIRQAIATRKKEMDWLIGRLGNLVLGEEDREQTEDLIFELREEIQSLERCFNVA